MSEAKEITLEEANRNKPTTPCPMELGSDVEYDYITGEMDFVKETPDQYEERGDLTWGEWYSEYKSVLPDLQVWQWHRWCWENRYECEDAREYVERFGKPLDRTTTRIKKLAMKTTSSEKAGTNKPWKKAEPKK